MKRRGFVVAMLAAVIPWSRAQPKPKGATHYLYPTTGGEGNWTSTGAATVHFGLFSEEFRSEVSDTERHRKYYRGPYKP